MRQTRTTRIEASCGSPTETLLLVALLLAIAAGATGCANAEPPRVEVKGTVTLDGQLLPRGVVIYIPRAGTPGARAAGRISDGRYAITKENGPGIGRFRVEIWGSDQTEVDDIRRYSQAGTVTVPREFNEQSTLQAETRAEIENRFDFHLKATGKGH